MLRSLSEHSFCLCSAGCKDLCFVLDSERFSVWQLAADSSVWVSEGCAMPSHGSHALLQQHDLLNLIGRLQEVLAFEESQ